MDAAKTIYLNIAGFNIQIVLVYTDDQFCFNKFKEEINKYLAGFITNKTKPDFIIEVVDSKITPVLLKNTKLFFINFYRNGFKNKIITYYQISFFHFQMVLRTVLNQLLVKSGFIIHGSAVSLDKKAIFFLGASGDGKSTAMQLVRRQFPALADDSLIVKKEGADFYFYQTPFIEKNYWIKKDSRRYSISLIFFLKKSLSFKIEKISNKEKVVKKLVNQFWTESDIKNNQMKNLLKFAERNNYFYYLYFAKNKNKLIELLRRKSWNTKLKKDS